ncbi:MAG: hypothetical protein H7Y89_13315 [Steroidobacteraceae bacterium]|nr:hypothetical protein [Steroidobacteraceae bacterium]
MLERRALILAAACLSAASAFAEPTATEAIPARPPTAEELKQLLVDASVARLNRLLGGSPSGGPETIQLKFFEPDGEGGEGGWGVVYDWKLAKKTQRMPEEEDIRSGEPFGFSQMSYQFALKGSHAFRDAVNNEDLSTATLSLHLDRADLGRANIDEIAGEVFQQCLMDAGPTPTDEQTKACIETGAVDRLLADEPTAWLYNLNFHGGLEANQDYTNSRGLYGLNVVFVSEPSAAASRYNVFDLPFRALRKSMSPGSRYRASFPSLSFSLDRLDAKDDEIRAAFTSKSTFTRASAEVAFQTILASFDEGPLRFNISYRYFHEFSPPEAIKIANLDSFDYTKMQLRFPARLLPIVETDEYELFVSYTDGKLPFDVTSGKAIEVGISTSIDMLARLLAK